MTNAEKFLKDGVKEEFIKEINAELDISFDQFNVEEWLKTPCKPTLTEDERVILKNIGEDCVSLMRVDGAIYFHTEGKGIFPKLFQFIKEGEEYEIKELLEND